MPETLSPQTGISTLTVMSRPLAARSVATSTVTSPLLNLTKRKMDKTRKTTRPGHTAQMVSALGARQPAAKENSGAANMIAEISAPAERLRAHAPTVPKHRDQLSPCIEMKHMHTPRHGRVRFRGHSPVESFQTLGHGEVAVQLGRPDAGDSEHDVEPVRQDLGVEEDDRLRLERSAYSRATTRDVDKSSSERRKQRGDC